MVVLFAAYNANHRHSSIPSRRSHEPSDGGLEDVAIGNLADADVLASACFCSRTVVGDMFSDGVEVGAICDPDPRQKFDDVSECPLTQQCVEF
jgi:hypothetical protein